MKSDFLLAITQLSAEKNLPKDVVIAAVEAALVSAYRKDDFAANQNISVKINPNNGKVQVWAEKTVAEQPSDSRFEISLAEAHQIKPDVEIGEVVLIEVTPSNAGRIAAQTAKQVILQRLHEAEHSAVFEEYANREGEIIAGVVQRIEARQIFVDLGRTEAILPSNEQVPHERYRIGQRIKVVILEVIRTSRGPKVVVSRSHPDLLRRLFEMEVPEIFSGGVELKAIAREAGSRSKVAVSTSQEGVDPVGCCVGLRGIRIQNIVNELHGEKIDVVTWSPDSSLFIANALSPSQIVSVDLDTGEGIATVVVPDRQLSLAIGKEGQNVRLAAKLTGWRIDIKSSSVAESEKIELEKVQTEEAEVIEPSIEVEEELKVPVEEEVPVAEEVSVEKPEIEETVAEEAEPLPVLDMASVAPPVPLESVSDVEKPQIRFAEDILRSGPAKSQSKSKKKKRSSTGKDRKEDEDGSRRPRRGDRVVVDDDEY